ncbi:hypothetical protein H7I76_19685 [Mycolicibacterium vaccae]|nr:hypothetical protein [Mycolicibacterium vaccae]
MFTTPSHHMEPPSASWNTPNAVDATDAIQLAIISTRIRRLMRSARCRSGDHPGLSCTPPGTQTGRTLTTAKE